MHKLTGLPVLCASGCVLTGSLLYRLGIPQLERADEQVLELAEIMIKYIKLALGEIFKVALTFYCPGVCLHLVAQRTFHKECYLVVLYC